MITAVKAKAVRKARFPRKASHPTRNLPRTAPDMASAPWQAAHSAVRPALSRHHLLDAADEHPFPQAGMPPAWKRALDLFFIFLTLPVTLPLMAAITLWIKLASPGPALFRQERIGLNGKRFVLYKFRSMKLNADPRRHLDHFRNLVRADRPMVKLDLLCDSRLIPGGCLLRAAGLDELPQLLNVLRGEMSLVGPRPCLPEELHCFTARQMQRFAVLPGLTGVWQVTGKGVSTFSEMNAMDALYVKHCSPVMDLSIMLRTPPALLAQMRQACIQHRAAAKVQTAGPSGDGALSGYNARHPG